MRARVLAAAAAAAAVLAASLCTASDLQGVEVDLAARRRTLLAPPPPPLPNFCIPLCNPEDPSDTQAPVCPAGTQAEVGALNALVNCWRPCPAGWQDDACLPGDPRQCCFLQECPAGWALHNNDTTEADGLQCHRCPLGYNYREATPPFLPKTGCYQPCGGLTPQPAVVNVNGAPVPFCCATCGGTIAFDPAAGFRCQPSGQLLRCLARYAAPQIRNFLPTLRVAVAPACPTGWRPFRGPDGYWHCYRCQVGRITQLPDRTVKCVCQLTCPTDHGYCHPWCWKRSPIWGPTFTANSLMCSALLANFAGGCIGSCPMLV